MKLLGAKIHEDRLLVLIILSIQLTKGNEVTRRSLYNYYLRYRRYINNWDLVDASAPNVVGAYLFEKKPERIILHEYITSPRLWDRRIAMVATHYFIRNGDFGDPLRLAKQLPDDTEDLMHKASGWMLHEVGKRDITPLKRFLDRYVAQMPRTMLRYAIERLPEQERRRYMGRK